MNHTRFVNKMYLINPGLQSKTCAARHNWNRHNLSSWPSLSPVISRFSSFALLFKTVIITVGRPAGLNHSDNFIELLKLFQPTHHKPHIFILSESGRIHSAAALLCIHTLNACLEVYLEKSHLKVEMNQK